jgi:hypothetical protein
MNSVVLVQSAVLRKSLATFFTIWNIWWNLLEKESKSLNMKHEIKKMHFHNIFNSMSNWRQFTQLFSLG